MSAIRRSTRRGRRARQRWRAGRGDARRRPVLRQRPSRRAVRRRASSAAPRREPPRSGGNGQCGLVVHSQLGDAADRRGHHGDSDRHGLHDRNRQTLGERREAENVGVPEVAVDFTRCKFAMVAHRVVEAESTHLGADLGLVGTRSDDVEGGGRPLRPQPRQRVEEDDVALLGREAGDDEDAWRFRHRPWRARGERVEVDPAAHDMKPVPQERVRHAAQLGAREVGDADDERSGRRLEVETGVRLVDEILEAVNREAPGPPLTVAEVADLGGEPRNRGGRLTEVGVEVGDAVARQCSTASDA